MSFNSTVGSGCIDDLLNAAVLVMMPGGTAVVVVVAVMVVSLAVVGWPGMLELLTTRPLIVSDINSPPDEYRLRMTFELKRSEGARIMHPITFTISKLITKRLDVDRKLGVAKKALKAKMLMTAESKSRSPMRKSVTMAIARRVRCTRLLPF